MITLTNEEVTSILMTLSRIDGYMFSINSVGSDAIHEEIDYPVGLLLEKLRENEATHQIVNPHTNKLVKGDR